MLFAVCFKGVGQWVPSIWLGNEYQGMQYIV